MKPNNKSHLPFGHSSSILDKETLLLINNVNTQLSNILYNNNINQEFINSYKEWINLTKKNNIKGLTNFKYICYSNGTTESFDKFYIKNKDRRFRCFKGEYVYHQLVWRNNWPNWKYIEDDELLLNDAVIISLPFSDTGDKHTEYEEILNKCNILKIPVLVDCAYFGICSDIDFDLDHPCITDVAFSLSKIFPVSHLRIGIRFTKTDDDDALFVYNKNSYTNRFGAFIGLKLINTFDPDYIVKRYKDAQIKLCKDLDILPSNTVLFGIDRNNKWPEYNRGTTSNRLGLHKFLHQGTLDI